MNKIAAFLPYGFACLVVMQALTLYVISQILEKLDQVSTTLELMHRQATIVIQNQNQKGH
jgi:hypothetical protein